MAHVYVGIDPGKEGALVRLAVEYPGQAEFLDTPIVRAAGSKAGVYDEVEMARGLRQLSRVSAGFHVLVVIEKVHAMPGQGVTSMFTFGMGYGIWLGIIAALGLPHVRVDPRTWRKSSLVDVAKNDAAVAAAAGRLYPAVSSRLTTPRGRALMGRVDALLLAHHGRVSGL